MKKAYSFLALAKKHEEILQFLRSDFKTDILVKKVYSAHQRHNNKLKELFAPEYVKHVDGDEIYIKNLVRKLPSSNPSFLELQHVANMLSDKKLDMTNKKI